MTVKNNLKLNLLGFWFRSCFYKNSSKVLEICWRQLKKYRQQEMYLWIYERFTILNFGVCCTFLSNVIVGGAILHSPYLRTSPKKHTQNRVKDTHGKTTVKRNSRDYRKYENGHLACWYIKSTFYEKLLNFNKIFK